MMAQFSAQQVLDAAKESIEAKGYRCPEIDIQKIVAAPPRAYYYKWYIPFKAVKEGRIVFNRMTVEALSGGLTGLDYDVDRPMPYSTPVW